MRLPLLALAWGLALAACSADPGTGPVEIAWDRDTCEHCYMTIGDRRAAAQIRIAPGGPPHLFDDLGCALLFLDAQREAHLEANLDAKKKSYDFAELWVRDSEGDRWLDGRAARYVEVAGTPMDYGFGAVAAPSGASLDEIWTRIREIEDERRRARR